MAKATMKSERARIDVDTLRDLIKIGHQTYTIPDGREDLEQHYSDEQDFWEVSAWGLKELLTMAYELGKVDGSREGK